MFKTVESNEEADITEKKSNELIKKIEGFASKYEAMQVNMRLCNYIDRYIYQEELRL